MSQNSSTAKMNCDDQYSPESDNESVASIEQRSLRKREKKQGVGKKQPKCQKSYFWTLEENLRYKAFLEENLALFDKSDSEKKSLRINVKMALYVKTRNSLQCRSHHQKMLKAYKTVQSIIDNIKEEMKTEEGTESEDVPIEKLNFITPTTVTNEVELRQIDIFLGFQPSNLWQKLTEDGQILQFLE